MNNLPSWANYLFLACATLSALTPFILVAMSRRQAQRSTAAAARMERVRTDLRTAQIETAQKLDDIHASVNGERDAMIQRMELMHKEILKLTSANVTLQLEKDQRNGG